MARGFRWSGTDLKDGLGDSQPATLEGAVSGTTCRRPGTRTKNLWEAYNLGESALATRGSLPGGQPVAGRLWTVQHRVARVNLLQVL